MEDKEAIDILKKLLDKPSVAEKEKEAIMTAIGALGWFKLGKNRMDQIIKAKKSEREKSNEKQSILNN